jgi:hypothetical protein
MKKIILTSLILIVSNLSFGQSVTISPQRTESVGNTTGDNYFLSSNSNIAGLISLRYRGPENAKTAVMNGDNLMLISAGGYFNSVDAAYDKGVIKFRATENWNGTSNGSKIFFSTTSNGSNNEMERMVINHDGKVGIGSISPQSKLHLHEPTTDLIQAMQVTTDGTGSAATDGLGFSIFSSSDIFSPRAARIRNNENGQLILGANNLDVLRITPTGNVGINSAFAPSARFQVFHDTENDFTKPHINVVTAVDANNGMIKMSNLTASRSFGQYFNLNSGTSANNFLSFDYNGTTPILDLKGNGNVNHAGFTKLGSDAPSIKVKKYAGNTASVDGGTIEILHGLGNDKIVSMDLMINYSGAAYIEEDYVAAAGYECNLFVGLGTINFLQPVIKITNKAGNSANVLNKPYKLIVTYEE